MNFLVKLFKLELFLIAQGVPYRRTLCKKLLAVYINILGIIRGQSQVKVNKGHQVQIFKKSIFEFQCTEKAFWSSWEVKITSRSPKVMKFKF